MRQKPLGNYIVDFYCTTPFIPPLLRGIEGFVIEIDGESHEGRFSYDMQRQQFLESMGLTVIRFNDADVKVDMNNVLMAIEGWIERNNPLTPFSKGELPTHFEKEPIFFMDLPDNEINC